jgi:hypothetical protein
MKSARPPQESQVAGLRGRTVQRTTLARKWRHITCGPCVGDAARLNIESEKKGGHLERLLMKTRIELFGRRP